ncbi:hypothetical protein [Myxosarcina sp. GI1(2024)]
MDSFQLSNLIVENLTELYKTKAAELEFPVTTKFFTSRLSFLHGAIVAYAHTLAEKDDDDLINLIIDKRREDAFDELIPETQEILIEAAKQQDISPLYIV